MSQVSDRSRDDSDTRSKQSSKVGARGAVQSPSASQQRSSSQVDQGSDAAGSMNRKERQASSSSSSSNESDQVRLQKPSERVEGPKITSHKQTTNDTARAAVVQNGQTTTVAATNTTVNSGYTNVGGGAYNVGGGAYNVGGGAYNVGGGAYNVGGGAYNFNGGAYNTGVSGASFSTGGDAYSLNPATPVTTTGERRKGRFRQEHVRLPDQAQGQVRQVRQRLPTPEPDTIERTLIQRAPAEIVEEITEIPMTPPPIVKERTVVEPAGPPQITKRTIRVPPRSGGFQQQPASGPAPNQFAFASSAPAQQFVSGYQQAPPANYADGLAVSSGYQQTAVPNFAVGRPPVVPPAGCHPAFCFYM